MAMLTTANPEMAAAWDGDEGVDWARDWEHYDRAVVAYHDRLMADAAVERGDVVLDVGCGTGEVTRDAARAAGDTGRALGVDLSSQMLERARALAAAAGLGNVAFEQADAQVHPFERAGYDVALSRFGAMFFADAVAAFINIASALRPGGRFLSISWQDLPRNEWLVAVRSALAVGRDLPAPPPGAPGPFGLTDPTITHGLLTAAGFVDVAIEAVEHAFTIGADAEDAFAFMRSTGAVRGLLQDLDDAQRVGALDELRATMAAHETPDGVVFGSACWLVTAVRPGR